MSRTVPSALLTALSQPEVQPYYAVELNFDSAPIRLWTGYGDLTIGVDTYTGSGNLLSIGGTTDTSSPIEVFSGLMNTMSIEDNGETGSISLDVESKLVRLERASNRRYTHENHISRNAGDTFFSFVADLQDKDVIWGRERA